MNKSQYLQRTLPRKTKLLFVGRPMSQYGGGTCTVSKRNTKRKDQLQRKGGLISAERGSRFLLTFDKHEPKVLGYGEDGPSVKGKAEQSRSTIYISEKGEKRGTKTKKRELSLNKGGVEASCW